MQSNLDALFKTSKELEKSGRWYEINDRTSFLVKRYGGSNSKKLEESFAKHYRPYAAIIERNGLPEEKTNEILATIFVESCLIDWKGIDIDGKKDVPYNQELAIKLFQLLPDLLKTLMEYAQQPGYYKEELEQAGN